MSKNKDELDIGLQSDITGDESTAYSDWKEYETAVEEGSEVAPRDIKPKKRKEYEFNVDKALDSIDLMFNGYVPSRDAVDFFNIIRLVLGEDPEVDNGLMHYFLVDLVFGNIKRENYPYSKEIQDNIRINAKKIAIIASRMSAKALTLDSKIYTPTGYTTMKDIKVGDEVLDRDGRACNVLTKSPLFNKDTYKITMADGRTIKTSGDHDNIIWKRGRRLEKGKNRCKNNRPSGMIETVMTTEEMYNEGVLTNRSPLKEGACDNDMKFYIPVLGKMNTSIDYQQTDYGFDAYTTGVILGDGSVCKKTGYTRITSHKNDIDEYNRHIPYMFGKMTKKINPDGSESDAYMFGLLQQGKRIKKWIGDERSYTKRVPALLMNGSEFQRLETLKGLMDTDGTVYKNGYCSFTSVSKGLAEDVQDLVRSLGGIAFISEYETPSSFGVAYSVRIKINKIIFKLKRKVERQHVQTRDMRVGIKSIEKIEQEPTQCIAVSSPTKSFLTDGYTVTHNSTIITAFLPIYLAVKGEMPNFGHMMFVVGFGDSQQAGAKVQANTIRDICEDSIFCKEYFEKMRFTDEECEFLRKAEPGKSSKIKDRAFMYKVKGAAGGSVRGIRYKTERPQMFLFDDIIKNEADANSKIIMAKLKSMIYADAENALGRKGKIVIVNTPFNKADPVYSALESGVWTPVCLPLCEKIGLETKKEEYIASWPAMHEYERTMERYEDAYYGGTLREFKQELMLRISSDEDRMVQENMIQWYSRAAMEPRLNAMNLYVTTDFTTTGSKGSDLSGIATWALGSNQDYFLVDLCLRQQEMEDQYNEVFRMNKYWGDKNGRGLSVGVETDGQQQAHILALKDRMVQRNEWFTIARQKGAKIGTEGIKSRLEGGNKHWRFRMMLPLFQNKKIWFPEELKDTPDMMELLEEIRYCTYNSFGSKFDDGIDLISQLGMMEILFPSRTLGDEMSMYGNSGNSGKRLRKRTGIWARIGENSNEDDTAYSSYS